MKLKLKISIIYSFFFVSFSIGQNFDVNIPAQYPGGKDSLINDIYRNLEYPAKAIREKIEGKVVLRFFVDTNGYIKKTFVLESLRGDCDTAAINAVQKLKRWTPATTNGKKILCPFRLPIAFIIPKD